MSDYYPSQEEVNKEIELHNLWLQKTKGGKKYNGKARYFKNIKFKDLNLNNIDFSNTVFEDVEFSNVDLTYVNFKSTEFCVCKFNSVNLQNSDLRNSNFINVIFKNIDFKNANFLRASFEEVHFKAIDFTNVKFSKSSFYNCSFKDITFPKQNFYQVGCDKRGYFFYAMSAKKHWHIYAGCRDYTIPEALAHWKKNPECLMLVQKLVDKIQSEDEQI